MENRRMGADSESELQHRGQREGRTAPHAAKGVAQVLRKSFELRLSPHLARHVYDQCDVSEFAAGGFFTAIFGGHAEVLADFVIEVVIAAAHACLRPGFSALAIASTKRPQRECSESNCFLPAGVRR